MEVANDAFLDETGFQVDPVGPFVLREYQEFDAMGGQIIEADVQDRSQGAIRHRVRRFARRCA
jgi:hypothetical protein